MTRSLCKRLRSLLPPCAAIAIAATAASAASPALALMAGALPDSPARRVDANTPASPWTSAVAVIVNGATYSGVVVAPRYVLTAAHVTGNLAPAAISVQINAQATPVKMQAVASETFPGAAFPHDDLALIELAAPVPASVRILPIYRQALARGQVLTLVGYGASGNGDIGATVAAAADVKRVGRNVLDAVRDTLPGAARRSLFYLFDFDGPSGNGPLGGPSLGNAVETGFAAGDSGSPAYAIVGGRTWLIGIGNFVWGSSAVGAYGFGTGGGGMLLSDPRFIAWLVTRTQDTLARPARPEATGSDRSR